MTTNNAIENENKCPAETLLKALSGKWKPQIFRQALDGSVRFNSLLRELKGSNRQGLATALKELEEQGLLDKVVVTQKPLHIEYNLSEKGRTFIPVFMTLENLS